MNNFKKNIFRTKTITKVIPPPEMIQIDFTNATTCYEEVQITVFTETNVKINMVSTFDVGALYADIYYLTGTNKKTANITDEVINSRTTYNFGMDAATIGDVINTSSITFTVNDFVTDEILYSFTLTRMHSITNC